MRTITAHLENTPYQVRLSDGLHDWLADEPATAGGGDSGPGPSDLVLSGLGACTAITLIMFASRKQWPLQGVDVTLDLAKGATPADGSRITRQIRLTGPLDDASRDRLLQVANACPVHKLLSNPIHIDTTLL